jgi:PhzF family phenazine biosynthesis protein
MGGLVEFFDVEVLRFVAFSSTPDGGNPAGVVLDPGPLSAEEMLAVAAELGYSETAFLQPDGRIRYFSPLAEVTFCGHATIATAIAHAQRYGPGALQLQTEAGDVTVTTAADGDGFLATLVSVAPQVAPLPFPVLSELLDALGWTLDAIDSSLPPRVAFAGAWHPIIATRTAERLAELDYDFEHLAALMSTHGWTTVNLVHQVGPTRFTARNPFPPGGVVEDPATGAAAAALGGYLREIDAVTAPARIVIRQGSEIGRPSVLTVDIPVTGGISVTGAGAQIPN